MFRCLLSPRAIVALFCALSPAWRLSWGVLGWVWLCGSAVSLVVGWESRGSTVPWNAELALVRAPPVHQHCDHGKAHTGTQNHPNFPSSTRTLARASLPCHHPGCATFLQILVLPTGIWCRAMLCCSVLPAGPGSSGCSAKSSGTGSNFPALKKLVKV